MCWRRICHCIQMTISRQNVRSSCWRRQPAEQAGDPPGGEVVIQTYSPEHYSIQRAAAQDYDGFYEEEINYRSLMGYPPVHQLLAVWMSGSEEEHLKKAAGYLKEFTERLNGRRKLAIIGPTAPFIEKVNDRYRQLIYIKSEEYKFLIEAKDLMEQYIEMKFRLSKPSDSI